MKSCQYIRGDSMTKARFECQERHVLVINDSQRRAIALEAAAYSVGRDPSNAIVIDVETISRQHAILLRVPVPGKNEYRYRVIDGNFEGKSSANGVFINNNKSSTRDLANGDVIRFGQTIEASYLVVSMGDVEFGQYLEGISYQSIKSETVNAKETLVATSLMQEELQALLALESPSIKNISKTTVSKTTLSKTTVSSPLAETLHEEVRIKDRPSRLWTALLSGALLVTGSIAGIWFVMSQSRPAQSSAETRYPALESQQVAPQ
jgi:pSer/pThr/pTyr-binding forkhead associated (FHA) protein